MVPLVSLVSRLACSLSLVSIPLAAPLVAQVTDEGYSATVRALPGNASFAAVLPNGVAWFTGSDLQLLENGQPVRTLLSYPAPTFGAFTLPLDATTILFADSSLPGTVWLVPTAPQSTPTALANVVLPYDAAPLSPGLAVLSAKTGGFGAPDNDLLLLDLSSGATTWLGSVAGASGAVAVDAQGALLYATAPAAFPAPLGTVQVLRWTNAQLIVARAGAVPLSAGNAQVIASGLDAAGDLVLDGDGDLLFTDWINDVVGELNDAGVVGRNDLVVHAGSGVSAATLQFVSGTGAFEPFAPATGGELILHETDFVALSQLRSVRPSRAVLAATPGGIVPRGPLALALQGAPANGLCLFALAAAPAPLPITLAVPGIEQSLLWDQRLLGGAVHVTGLDAAGGARLNLVNPGFPLGLQVLAACAFVDAPGRVIGSSAVQAIALGN